MDWVQAQPANRAEAPAVKSTPSKGKPIQWSKLTLADSLDDYLRYAATTKNPDEAYSGVQISIVCTTVAAIPEGQLEGIAAYQLQASSDKQRAAALEQMKASRTKLSSYCANLKTPENLAAVKAARETAFSGASITRALSYLPKIGENEAPTQEQLQASMLVLTQPGTNAIGVDRVLSSGIIGLPSYLALSREQRSIVQSYVYADLTGDRNSDSVRNVAACFYTGVCPGVQSGLTAEQYQSAQQVGQQIISLIRSQNWTALHMQR